VIGSVRPVAGAAARRIALEIDIAAGDGPVEVEIFSPAAQENERRLVGSWKFDQHKVGDALVEIDWLAEPASIVSLSDGALTDFSHDPGTLVRPAMEVVVSTGGKAHTFDVHVTDTAVLERYYNQDSHQDEYVVEHPFFHAFHEARMRVIGGLFRQHIKPGSRVLDVGSGYSIFFLITTDWDFDMTCCDLDSAAMDKMRGLVPSWNWMVADAVDLPFEDDSFDAVYAGEIIEHVQDTDAALAEWGRVLKPGGTLILSTPNRDRLLSRANRRAMPVHPEHVLEMNLPEIKAALVNSGFLVKHATGIYLELLLNWYRPAGQRVDMLISLFDKPRYAFAYRVLMWTGKLAPTRAFDLVLVCTKK